MKNGGDFIYTIVNSVADTTNDPQAVLNRYVVEYEHPRHGTIKSMGFPYSFSKTPANIQRGSPEINEHCEEILTEEAGYTKEEISEFIRLEIV